MMREPPLSGPARSARIRRPLLALVAAGVLAAGAFLGWRAWPRPAFSAAALPPPPSTAGWPAILPESIARAQARAAARGTALEGVEELGRLYHANGFMREAEACWRLLHAVQPGEARWAHLLADLRRAAGDYEGMEALLREVVRLAPDYAPAWLQLANHAFKTGRPEEAGQAFARRLQLVPRDPYARLGLARLAMQEGRTAEARRLMQELVREQPKFAPAQNLLAELLAAEGDETAAAEHRRLGNVAIRYFEPADPWLDALIDVCHDPKRLRVLATIEYQIERGDRGVALMERAARLEPDQPDGYAALGDLYIKLGDAARARTALERCLELSGDSRPAVMVFVNLSHALRRLGQPGESLPVLERARRLHPQAFELHDELGIVLAELGRLEASVAAFEQAIALHPGDANANCNLALVLLNLDRRDQARAALHRALALQPTFPKALSMLGRIELEDGRLAEAERHLRPLHAAHPHVPEARYMLAQWELLTGRAAAARNDEAAAERHYRAGVAIDPDHADLQATLGAMLLVQGRVGEALAPLQAYRRLQSTNPQAALFLGQAYARLGRFVEARLELTEGVVLAERTGNTATANFCREILSQLP